MALMTPLVDTAKKRTLTLANTNEKREAENV
jgi:hypothetical protein